MKIELTKKQFYVLKYSVMASIMVRAAQIHYHSPELSGIHKLNIVLGKTSDRSVLGSFELVKRVMKRISHILVLCL